jgi:DNA-binding transcriptional regulator YdaS (Cro superfamily)
MTLADWLRNAGLTNLQLAERLGVSEECARLYRSARRRPGPAIARRILHLTKGAVTQNDLTQAYDNHKKGSPLTWQIGLSSSP